MSRVAELRAKYVEKVLRGRKPGAKYIMASKSARSITIVKEPVFAGPGDVVGESELGLNLGFERWCE